MKKFKERSKRSETVYRRDVLQPPSDNGTNGPRDEHPSEVEKQGQTDVEHVPSQEEKDRAEQVARVLNSFSQLGWMYQGEVDRIVSRPDNMKRVQIVTEGLNFLNNVRDMAARTKSALIIVMPSLSPDLLEFLAQAAYEHKARHYRLATYWDLVTYGGLVKKMMVLGNVSFMHFSSPVEYWALARDNEEIMLAIGRIHNEDPVCITITQKDFVKLFCQFIGPMIQASSQTIR